MEIVRRVRSMKEIARQARGRRLKIGLVPTMGYLHEGHLTLVRAIKEVSDVVVVSIFVNPTQFGPNEDYERYPRDLTRDVDLCIAEGVNYLFVPEATEIYPGGPRVWVHVDDLSDRYEGASRPGHFRGVATVVLKLFEIVSPTIAAFGEKDAQQLAVIRRMARDLMLDVEIQSVPTVREESGLAMSSRNSRLSVDERKAAQVLPRALESAAQSLREERSEVERALTVARRTIDDEPLAECDYVALVDPETFLPVEEASAGALVIGAARVGPVRLIDNLRVPAAEE